MVVSHRLEDLLMGLLKVAYPELEESRVSVSYGKPSAFASVRWETNLDSIDVILSNETDTWHDAALSGLLAHELSHPSQKGSGLSEKKTDSDVLKRGLGLYLAVERLFVGKYEDHVIRRGKDRYLGYRTIRGGLSEAELSQLDRLLADMSFIPRLVCRPREMVHDVVRIQKGEDIHLLIDGSEIHIANVKPSTQIQIVERDGTISALVDGHEQAQLRISAQLHLS